MKIVNWRIKDLISPERWKQVLIYFLKQLLKKLDTSPVSLTRNELLQYAYRAAKCTDCLYNKSCLHCGCNTAGKMSNKTDYCSNEYWGVFMTDEEMDEFLKKNEFIFDVKIVKKNV